MLSSCKPEVPEPNTYTVSFNANGGTGEMKSITADEGSEITLSANTFTKTGYTFTEWNTKADGNGEIIADEAKIKLTANTTLYAQWTANNYTVKFDANGGSGDAPKDIPATYDVEFDIPENTFTKIGYNFAGWNTEKEGSGTNYEAKANVKNLTIENGATVTLYAKWVDRGTHNIVYELNGGNHSGTPTTSFKETEDVTLGKAERTGYTFGGWYESEKFSGTAVTSWKAGEKTEDVILYAKWEANNYTIKYELDGGTNAIDNPASYTIETETITLNAPTKDGYTFEGWYTDNTFTDGNKVTEITKGSIGEMTLYAKWELIITAENICNVIEGLPEGRHTISVTGEIPESKFTEIKEAIKANTNAKVNLDLSSVTGLSTIPSNAFSDCGNLVGIVIPETESGIKLGSGAFDGCSGLENIYLPKNISMDYHEYVFSDCSSLSQVNFGGTMEEFTKICFYEYPDIFKAAITFSDGNSWTMGKDIRDSSEENPEISYSGEWNEYMLRNTLNNSAKRLNLLDLSEMTGLTEISYGTNLKALDIVKLILPSCATKVCKEAFWYSKIESIVIPGNIKTIENNAFGSSGITNSSLSNVEIGYGVESIGSYAFACCKALKNVNIPASVTSIGGWAFYQVAATIINYSGTMEQWSKIEKDDWFASDSNIKTIKCSDGDITLE